MKQWYVVADTFHSHHPLLFFSPGRERIVSILLVKATLGEIEQRLNDSPRIWSQENFVSFTESIHGLICNACKPSLTNNCKKPGFVFGHDACMVCLFDSWSIQKLLTHQIYCRLFHTDVLHKNNPIPFQFWWLLHP